MQIKNKDGEIIFESEDRKDESGCIKVNLSGAELKYACLDGANLAGADIRNAKLDYVWLDSANLSYADLEESSLAMGNMGSANFFRANLKNADLYGSFLNMANFQEANLEGVNLQGSNLAQANLRGANLTNANLGPDNTGVETALHSADLTNSKIDGACFNQARYDMFTIFPEGFNPKEHEMQLDTISDPQVGLD